MTPTGQHLIRLALGAAQSPAAVLDAADQALMVSAVQMDAIERLSAAQRGQVLARALMAPHPVGFFSAMRDCTGLKRLLPEVNALFGVPQLSDGPDAIDVGEHQLRVLDVTARRRAPLAVRFAALMHKIGKGATPRLFWPSHVGHEQRGLALLATVAERIALPATGAFELAALAIAECDRVHRASDLRAGPIAALLERVQAETRPERFEQLLEICICDHAAHAGHGEADYVKAPRMRRALAAYLGVAPAAHGSAGALLEARAVAIDRALRGGPCAGEGN